LCCKNKAQSEMKVLCPLYSNRRGIRKVYIIEI
jgi:hypothetical protein